MIDNMTNKINANAINSYKAINKAKTADSGVVADVAKKAGGSFDTVEINFAQSMESAKANIANNLNAATDVSKLDALKMQYARGVCPVSIEDIAKSVCANGM